MRQISLTLAALGAAIALCGVACQPALRHESTPGTPQNATNPNMVFAPVSPTGLNYSFSIPGERPLDILQTIGNGCAFLDFDADGNLDILLVGKSLGLFKGDGRGGFVDVSKTALPPGLTDHFLGCAVGDFNGDGFPDLYLSAYDGGRLLKNDSGARFVDVTAAARLPKQPWGTSCAFFDADSDGALDLFVGNYVVFGPKSTRLCGDGQRSTSCGPRHYDPRFGTLYRQNPKTGTFSPMPLPKMSGKVLGIAVAPPHGNEPQQVALANDEMPGDLLRKTGTSFENDGELSGTAYDRGGSLHGGMGVDWGDVNGDGRLDLFVATFQNEDKCLYLNESGGLFAEQSQRRGLIGTYEFVAFGCKFLDFDNDGDLDLLIANGHVQSNAAEITRGMTYRQTPQLFRNDGEAFVDVSGKIAGISSLAIVGRGLAIGDYDNDGKIDALIVDSEGKPVLLHNQAKSPGSWIGLSLSFRGGDAVGAVVTAEIGGKKIVRHCHTDGSYLSASDARVLIGLGSAKTVDKLTIRWPDGATQVLKDVAVDRYVEIARPARR